MLAARNIFITVRTSWSLYASGLKGIKSRNRNNCRLKPWKVTLPETNIAPENQWLEDDISVWDGLFSGACISLGEGKSTVKTKVSNFG